MSGGHAHHGDAGEPGGCGEALEEVCRDALPALVSVDDKLCDPTDGLCKPKLGAVPMWDGRVHTYAGRPLRRKRLADKAAVLVYHA